MAQSCVKWAKYCKVAQNNIYHGRVRILLILKVTLNPIEVVLVVVFCCLI